jgi:hypothetical protein
MRTLLIQASLPPRFWAESLHTATYLLNRLHRLSRYDSSSRSLRYPSHLRSPSCLRVRLLPESCCHCSS